MRKRDAPFHFKQFSIHHDRCTMKVGTDGVLLGAWVAVHNAQHILDIGTGSGVIALMLAQRSMTTTEIDAIEIEPDDAQQARENVQQSPWSKKVKVHECAIQDFQTSKKYDLIISNPPFFRNSFRPPSSKRLKTRHTDHLPFSDLISSSTRLLQPKGRLNVILPFQEGLDFIELARENQLHCTRQLSFRTRPEKPIERWLLEFSFEAITKQTEELLLYSSAENWSEDYLTLTHDFYLFA